MVWIWGLKVENSYVHAGHFSQFFVIICHIYSGQFVFTEMSFMVQCSFMIALPKGASLVHHPTKAIHQAHHCMASTRLVQAMQLAWHQRGEMQAAHLMRATSLDNRQKMHGHHVMDVGGRSKESYTKREGSMKSSRE